MLVLSRLKVLSVVILAVLPHVTIRWPNAEIAVILFVSAAIHRYPREVYMLEISDLIGVPFVNGGRNKGSGLDCWGLTIEVFRRYGIELPDFKVNCEDASRINSTFHSEVKHWNKCEGNSLPVPAVVVIRFNDNVFCNHTGVYVGDLRFIHTREKVGVNIDRIDSPVWRHKIEGFYIPGW
jgi:cell wall-associated NlpC family hydrolase